MTETPIANWLKTASREDLLEGSECLYADAAYLTAQIDRYNRAGMEWIAEKLQVARNHSINYANAATERAKGL